MKTDELEIAYELALWKDDPWSAEGRERYLKAKEVFRKLLAHPWLKEILTTGNVRVLDLGSGKGIGGVAFTESLTERGIRPTLTMVDVRSSAVEASLKFAEERGVKAEVYAMNALDAYKLGTYDIVLMYGAIFAHFNSWDMCRLLASASEALAEKGVMVIEEFDRVHNVFMGGFKDIILENPKPENITISFYVDYNPVTGSYLRRFVRLRDGKNVLVPLNFRSISTIASLLWIFMKDVDMMKIDENLYLILGKDKRGAVGPSDLAENPKILTNKEI